MAYPFAQLGSEGPAGMSPTLAGLLDGYDTYACRVRGLEAETIREQRLYLERFVSAQSESSPAELFASLTTGRVQSFIVDYAQTHGPGSQRWMHTSLRAFLRYCHSHGYVTHDLSLAVPAFHRQRLASVPRSIDDSTVALLLESIDERSPAGLRDLAIIQLLATYGVRGIHVRRLCLDDIRWAENQIHFRAAKKGKPIVQHLTEHVGNTLLKYIREGRENSVSHPEVFLSSRPPCHPIRSSAAMSQIIKHRLEQAGIELSEGVSRGTHSFRHGFAARLTGKLPLKHIADMLGHRDLCSAFIYTKVDFRALGETALPWPEESTR